MNTNLQVPDRPSTQYSGLQIKIAYAGNRFKDLFQNEDAPAYMLTHYESIQRLENVLEWQSILELPDVLLLEIDDAEYCFSFIEKLKNNPHLSGILTILLSSQNRADWKAKALSLKVLDYYVYPFNATHLHERIKLLLKLRILQPLHYAHDIVIHKDEYKYRMPVSKRIFDIICSTMIIMVLMPLMLIVAIFIMLESRGPIIYISKRVGTGYKIFNFYKFRTMQPDADKKVDDFRTQNLYNTVESESSPKSVFFKLKDDPRITKVGRFLRNTSIDELPQLFNILIGDMSFVGNRPLPLYEAEQLTSNEWSMRFLGPAGLTGLWQITKRGKKDMSERERKELDNYYAQSCSMWLDMKIILKTFPALIQAEAV